jgi:hypothetical protein
MMGLSLVKSESNSLVGSGRADARSRLQRHQVHHVDHANLQIRACCLRSNPRRPAFRAWDVAAAGHHHVGLAPLSLLAHSQMPMPAVQCLMADPCQPLQRGLLAGHDHVDVVAAAQAMIGDREQRVGVGRQIDAHDVGLLVDHVIDEAGVLMAEAVVVLPPDVRGEQVIERRDGPAPGNVRVTFSHLACWLNMESTMWMKAS